jgi:hypothetical protein
MKEFTPKKVIRRKVTIRSADPGLPTAEWVLELGEGGVAIRRAGEGRVRARLAWRTIIGMAMVHYK